MDYQSFTNKFEKAVPVGAVMDNPGGGISEIMSYPGNQISYLRGNSRIYVSLQDLFDAYDHFKGGQVSTTDLKAFNPAVFDSSKNGHSCNCTFLFLALQRMGIAGGIQGEGVRGSPYSVEIPDE